jgi:hypothetical protein
LSSFGISSPYQKAEAFGVPAENIRWMGSPPQGLRLRRSDIFAIPFSLFWCGFVVMMFTTPTKSGPPTYDNPVAYLFLFVGLYFLIGRFLWDAYVRANTQYALTDDTAVILRRGIGGGMSNLYIPSINNLNVRLQRSGVGTIFFGDAPNIMQELSSRQSTPAFYSIPNASAVYEQCKTAQRKSAS